MKLVMTLLARDEADVVEANLRYHLESGVDFVIATDNGSADGTRELLAEYERADVLHLIDQPTHDADYGPWRTRMARMAATDFGADWVINNDADEFWWPDRGSLKEVLEEIPREYGIIRAPKQNFFPRSGDAGFFADRMVARRTHSPKHRRTGVPTPLPKTAHRARADISVGSGNHAVEHPELGLLGGWYPIQILHFPVRSYLQFERRTRQTTLAKREGGLKEKNYGADYAELERGELRRRYEELAPADAEVEAGVRAGSMVIDMRLKRFFEEHGRPARRDLWDLAPGDEPEAPLESARPLEDVEREARMLGSIAQYGGQLFREERKLRRRIESAERARDEERDRRQEAERRLKAAGGADGRTRGAAVAVAALARRLRSR
ncbi:MAG: glycosyltransferase family 2 protein [Thermoleophilaceae bacterium]